MAKICASCGKEYKGEYCEHCGYGDPNLKTHAADKYKTKKPVRYMTPEEKEAYYAELKEREKERRKTGKKQRDPKQTRLLIITAIVVVLFIVGTLFMSGSFGGAQDPNELIEEYFTAINERNFGDYAACMPYEIKREVEADLAATNYSESEYMEAYCADFAEAYGSDFVIEYSIGSAEVIDDYSMADYKAAYGSVPKITEAQLVVVNVTFRGSKGEETFVMNAYAGKVGRNWKMFNLAYSPGTITPDMEIE